MGPGKDACSPDADPAGCEEAGTGVNVFELEENLRLSHWERLIKHDKKLKEWIEFEEFMSIIRRGWIFIQSQDGHSHKT